MDLEVVLLSGFNILLKVSLLWKNPVCPKCGREPKGSIVKHGKHGKFTRQQGLKQSLMGRRKKASVF